MRDTDVDPKMESGRYAAFRVVYMLELIAVVATVAGMLLFWWHDAESYTAFDLLSRTTATLEARSPRILGQPLIVLWLMWPSVIVSGLRSIAGMLVTPVSFRRLALALWLAALLVLVHFYLAFGGELPERAPLLSGKLQIGFWLTGSSTVLLGLLILTEFLIQPRFDVFTPAYGTTPPAGEAPQTWDAAYQICPYCGMMNMRGAATCFNCDNVLFDYRESRRQGEGQHPTQHDKE